MADAGSSSASTGDGPHVAIAQVLKRSPNVATQTASLGHSFAKLAWANPDRTTDLARILWVAVRDVVSLVMAQLKLVANAAKHAQQSVMEVARLADEAPESAQSTGEHAAAAVTDVVKGVTEPSAKKLGASAVEGLETTGSATATAASAPRTTLGLVKDTAMAAASAAVLPITEPRKTMAIALDGALAARDMAGLVVSAPGATGAALVAGTLATKDVGAAVIAAVAAGRRLPRVLYLPYVSVTLPWLLLVALAGLVTGLVWGAVSGAINLTVTFLAACIVTAAHVLAGRFQALIGPEEDMKGGDGTRAPYSASDIWASLNIEASSLVFGPARNALLEGRRRLEAKGLLATVGDMAYNAAYAAGRRLYRIAFWHPTRTDASKASNPADNPAGYLPPAELSPAPAPELSPAPAPAAARPPPAVDHGGAVTTPHGDLLPVFALGMPNGPYSVHAMHAPTKPLQPQAPATADAVPAVTELAPSGPVAGPAKDTATSKTPFPFSLPARAWDGWVRPMLDVTAATFAATFDSAMAFVQAAGKKEEGEALWLRARRVGSLVMQPVVLWVALLLAVAETGIWLAGRAAQVVFGGPPL